MHLKRGLALHAYTLTGTPTTDADYADLVEELSFTTIAPGGYGDLTATLKVPNARLMAQRPELGLMQRVALMDGPFPVFLGRWDEPAVTLSSGGQDGEHVALKAQGAATCCQDDPQDSSYSARTAGYIINDQMTSSTLKRNATLALDADQGLVLPDSPAATFSPSYSGKNLEDVLNQLLPSVGDYTWCVWGHARNRDACGFPTWQMQAHKRDTSTVAYTAYLVDEDAFSIAPAVEYAYNVVTLTYRDATTLAPASVTVSDSRLAGSGAQGSAPFTWRRIRKDYTSLTLSGTQAAAVANAFLADYQNGGAKITVDVRAVRDANGVPIPLWQVRADANVFLPELAPLSAALPTAISAYSAARGGNLFYITETEYREGRGQAPTLTLTCNSFRDTATFQISRLQMLADAADMSVATTGIIQASGAPEIGACGFGVSSGGGAGVVWSVRVNFKAHMTATPTSITLSAASSSNVTGVSATNIGVDGFTLAITQTASGAFTWQGSYTTNGN